MAQRVLSAEDLTPQNAGQYVKLSCHIAVRDSKCACCHSLVGHGHKNFTYRDRYFEISRVDPSTSEAGTDLYSITVCDDEKCDRFARKCFELLTSP